jgi:phosphate transport system protein
MARQRKQPEPATPPKLNPVTQLSPLVVRMAGHAESQLEAAIGTLMRRDAEAAQKVRSNDESLDKLQAKIDREAQALLIRQRPDETELNEILGAMRIAADLERIGDYAANIAKRAVPLAALPDFPRIGTVGRMGKLVCELLSSVADAYSHRDPAGAIDVWHRDEDLDDLYTSLHREVLTHMMEDQRNIRGYIHILFIAKNIERIGDHATNIAESVHLILRGKPFEKARPKGVDATFQPVPPADTDQAQT